MKRWKYKIPLRFQSLFRKSRIEQDLGDELRFHLEKQIEEYLSQGIPAGEARYKALRELGGLDQIKEECRDMRRTNFIENLYKDLHYGLRMLAKTPGLTVAVVLSLALGIGANAAIFTLINAVMFQMLPVKQPEQLVLLNWATQGWPRFVQSLTGNLNQDKSGRSISTSFSYPAFEQIRTRNSVFSGVLAFADPSRLNVGVSGQAGVAEGTLVSGDFFSTLKVEPLLGRPITPRDDKPDASPVAVISFGYWERRFGHDPSVIGKNITVNGVPFTILGVTPPEFFGVQPGLSMDIYLPAATQPQVHPDWAEPGKSKFTNGQDWWVLVIGRLKPGVAEQQARAALDVILRQSVTGGEGALLKESELPGIELSPASKGLDYLRQEFSKPLTILMTVVGLVLLIACANVANLLLARAATRRREIAVRLALGANRQRLVRQLLTESLLLALLGGIAGLLLAFWTRNLLVAFMSKGEILSLNVKLDLRVLLFTSFVSLLTGILFGLAPALRATRLNLTPALKDGAGSSPGLEQRFALLRFGLGRALVISQVAISLLLLVGAGLFVRSLQNLKGIQTGFNQRNLLLFGLDPTQAGYKGQRLKNFYGRLRARLEAIPGVRSASLSQHTLIGGGGSNTGISILGYTPKPGESYPDGNVPVSFNRVSDEFFETLGIPLLLGRTLTANDVAVPLKVAVVNEVLIRKFFGNSNPLGQHFKWVESSGESIEIIGVVGNSKYANLREDAPPTVYSPYTEFLDGLGSMNFEVRTSGEPKNWITVVRDAVQGIDSGVPLLYVRTQIEQIDQTLYQERLFARLTSFFGLLALTLACVGLYGTMSYSVARRTNEIGIRIALGAGREVIFRMILREALLLLAAGLAIGVPAALALNGLVSSYLYGLRPNDPLVIFLSVFLMTCIATIAGFLPSRRATKVDPMVALRYE